MKFIKRILFFLSLFVLYIIAKEFLQLYVLLSELHAYVAYGFIGLVTFLLIYFVIIPVVHILKIPKSYGPVKDPKKEDDLIHDRIELFKKNDYLQRIHFDFSDATSEKDLYFKIIHEMEKETHHLRKKHVSQMFYSTSIAQNGFLDAVLILSGSINHIKEIFLLYNGRVSNRDLLIIGQKIYYSMAIGGSEGVEYATNEVFSKFATEGIKSIPFIDKILASIADGLVNATMLTRISYITENYCKKTYIRNDRELYPKAEFIVSSAKSITYDIVEKLLSTMKKMAIEKTVDFTLIAVNPIGYVIGKTIDWVSPDSLEEEKKMNMKEYGKLVGNPIAFGLEKLFGSFKKKRRANEWNHLLENRETE